MASQVARGIIRGGRGSLITRPRRKTPADFGELIIDPSIERWSSMRETTTEHFKWSFKTGSMIAFWVIGIPFSLYHIIREDVQERHYGGKEGNFFPDNVLPQRVPDPLPPRKLGIRLDLK